MHPVRCFNVAYVPTYIPTATDSFLSTDGQAKMVRHFVQRSLDFPQVFDFCQIADQAASVANSNTYLDALHLRPIDMGHRAAVAFFHAIETTGLGILYGVNQKPGIIGLQ